MKDGRFDYKYTQIIDMDVSWAEESIRLQDRDGRKSHRTNNKRRILITGATGCIILALIILGIVLLSKHDAEDGAHAHAQRNRLPTIELEEILEGSLVPARFNGTYISDTEIMYKNKDNEIVLFDVVKKTSEVLLSGESVLESALSFQLSADRNYLFIAHTFQNLYRYSFIAHYDIYNLKTKQRFPLENNEGLRFILLAQWAPTGNGIAFVLHENLDIYYKPNPESTAYRITNTGLPTVIYNGVPDWVNEEEVFNSNVAMWFSKDSKKLAFASFNDSQTRVMSIPFYGLPGNLDFQYSRAVNIRYPKPGSPNPVVSLHVAHLENLNQGSIKVLEVPPPHELKMGEPILTAVTWPDENHLSAVWANRVQNMSYVTLCDSRQTDCRNILTVTEDKGWVDFFVPPLFSSDGSKMALILPQNQGPEGDFRHACLAEKKGPTSEYVVRPLTKGKYTVTDILFYDDIRNLVYYLATVEGHPEQLHLFVVSTAGTTSGPECLSCNVKTELQNKPCLYNRAVFGKGKSPSYTLSCLGPGIPEISVFDTNNNKLILWENNKFILDKLGDRALPIVERITVPVPGGFNAVVTLFLPPDIDRSGKTKYPLLVNVYAGPDSYQATEKFSVDWNTYLTGNKSIICATIDGRGSGLKGNKMVFSIYRRLGTYEIEDQIEITSYLQQNYPYIDGERSAIWGWSYGGYATAMALAQDRSKVFKCGISVAPVTDWAYYDTIYTERYMGLPRRDDNLLGYAEAQLNDKVENIRTKQFFLVHGTLDDNVHYQQSMMLSKALAQSDILFRQQTYPDEEHGLAGVRPHLYHSIEKFLNQCYDLE